MRKILQVVPFIDDHEGQIAQESIDSKWLTEGPKCQDFLRHITEFTGAKFAVLAPNGTLALHLALLALELPPQSEVLLPSFTFFGSASAIVFAGLVPSFVDVDIHSFNVDSEKLEAAITPNTTAIMPVHCYGHSANMDAVMDIAKRHGLKVIEDAAQGYGVFYGRKHTGTIGDIGTISFFADKTITMGEGGVVLTNDEATYLRLRLLRNQGRQNSGTFIHEALGMNYRITDIQAGIGLAQVAKFDAISAHKTRVHALYVEAFSGIGDLDFIEVEKQSTFVPFRFALRTKQKDALIEHLEAAGIQSRSFFYPMHLQPPLRRYSINGPHPSVSERLYSEGILLPIHMNITDEDVAYMADTVRSFFEKT